MKSFIYVQIFSLWSFLLPACVAGTAPCDKTCDGGECDGSNNQGPFECWYRTTYHNYAVIWGCPTGDCVSTGNGSEIECRCEGGCKLGAGMLPDPNNPHDGIDGLFACFWGDNSFGGREVCYRGPKEDFHPFIYNCMCYCGFYCWRECEGRYSDDGRMVCMVDGEEVGCQEAPNEFDPGRVVLCRHGVGPVPWPLPDELKN